MASMRWLECSPASEPADEANDCFMVRNALRSHRKKGYVGILPRRNGGHASVRLHSAYPPDERRLIQAGNRLTFEPKGKTAFEEGHLTPKSPLQAITEDEPALYIAGQQVWSDRMGKGDTRYPNQYRDFAKSV